MLPKLRVHIAPVGFEVDRIVIPANDMKADRVWLLVHENPTEDRAREFTKQITEQLKKAKIEVKFESHNRHNLFNIIKTVRKIIKEEEENNIYVNLASGSKIQAIACMMGCMIPNENKVAPFYVEAEKYGTSNKPISTGVKKINEIQTYKMHIPKRELIETLKIIQEKERITKKELAKILKEREILTINAINESQATFTSLDKNIIKPLQDNWDFINVKKIGRNRWITITESGKNAAEFLS